MITSRKRALFITILDFVIIFFVVFLINNYLLSTKSLTIDNLKLKFKYDKLKNGIGYIFAFDITNIDKKEKNMDVDNKVIFYIQNKGDKSIIWKKHVEKPSFPMDTAKEKTIVIKPEGHISYTYIFDAIKEVQLPQDDWSFGVNVDIGTNKCSLSIPVTTKRKKGLSKLFK